VSRRLSCCMSGRRTLYSDSLCEAPFGEQGLCILLVDSVRGLTRWLITVWHESQARFWAVIFVGLILVAIELGAIWLTYRYGLFLALMLIPWSAGACVLSAAQLTEVKLSDANADIYSVWRFDADVLVRAAAGHTWHAVAHRRELPDYAKEPESVYTWWTHELGQVAVAHADGRYDFLVPDEAIACYYSPLGWQHVRFEPTGNDDLWHLLLLLAKFALCVLVGNFLSLFALHARWPEQSECDRRVMDAAERRERPLDDRGVCGHMTQVSLDLIAVCLEPVTPSPSMPTTRSAAACL